jgi:hypothetical protein
MDNPGGANGDATLHPMRCQWDLGGDGGPDLLGISAVPPELRSTAVAVVGSDTDLFLPVPSFSQSWR